jgi:hypothetical protein
LGATGLDLFEDAGSVEKAFAELPLSRADKIRETVIKLDAFGDGLAFGNALNGVNDGELIFIKH